MREAITDASGHPLGDVGFYDRKRLAGWIGEYPGIELWLRERLGEPLAGWRGYGRWSGDAQGAQYVLDDHGRLLSKTRGRTDAMPVLQGIEDIRKILAKSGGVVRLIGLSGMGKTRLAEALFDETLGDSPLDPSTVMYLDQGHRAEPSARDMLAQLGANGLRAIVIVDNCNPALHRALTRTVSEYPTVLSLLRLC